MCVTSCEAALQWVGRQESSFHFAVMWLLDKECIDLEIILTEKCLSFFFYFFRDARTKTIFWVRLIPVCLQKWWSLLFPFLTELQLCGELEFSQFTMDSKDDKFSQRSKKKQWNIHRNVSKPCCSIIHFSTVHPYAHYVPTKSQLCWNVANHTASMLWCHPPRSSISSSVLYHVVVTVSL